MITEQQFEDSALRIGCKVAAIKAVKDIESSGGGFLSTGFPKILFEPHIFWKELKKAKLIPVLSEICYPIWKTKPYGSVDSQPARLDKAVKINRNCALMSASWGLFQIMGYNYKTCGCKTIQEFVNRMMKDEDEQLELFTTYIINSNLDDELINEDWAGFARGYNGAAYARNNYDKKLKAAFLKYK